MLEDGGQKGWDPFLPVAGSIFCAFHTMSLGTRWPAWGKEGRMVGLKIRWLELWGPSEQQSFYLFKALGFRIRFV